jgi:hypothetical protein
MFAAADKESLTIFALARYNQAVRGSLTGWLGSALHFISFFELPRRD